MFSKIYCIEQSKTILTDYIVIAQLLVGLQNKINIQALISKHHNNLVGLKAELENSYNQHFADKNIESDNEIKNLIKKFSEVEYPLSEMDLEIMENKYKKLVAYSTTYKKMSLLQLTIEAAKEADLIKSDRLETEPDLKILAILREGIKHEFGIYPYNTQMLVVLSLLHDPDGDRGKLAQVLTGEGKSTTITLLALYLALTGQHVDIVTSSQDLAIRDQKKYGHFFELFNISSSHISYQDPEAKHFNAKIIYGTNYDFEFAVLRTKVYDKKLFIENNRVVIVDEVDNLFIDTALNSARISCPSKHDMSWIYEPILNYVKGNSLMSLRPFLNLFINTSITLSNLKKYLQAYNPKEFASIKQHLSDEYLKTLVSSAQTALQKQLNKDYVVRFDQEKGKQEVIIVDFDNTGRLNYGSRWSGGIHEFIEVINGLKPEAESLTIASISHPSFFSLYSKIYGLTGTMGEAEERLEVQTIYDINFFDVPPHKPSKKQPLVSKFVNKPDDHYKQILLSIKLKTMEGQPVLVLFQSIEESERFSKILTQNKLAHNVLNEIQETNKEYILNKAGEVSNITIATNNAGRGTDIILSLEAIENGGLHVIISFLPANLRVEEQVSGRAGRQGQPGSSEMIISIDDPAITSLKSVLSRLPEDQAIKMIMENRSSLVKKLSQYRLKASEAHQEMYKLLNKFTESLNIIKNKLKETDISNLSRDYQHYKIVQSSVIPSKNLIMDNLYKQGASLIAHQTKGNLVDWGQFISEVREKYITILSQKWAEFFTKLGKGITKASDNASYLTDQYNKFYETELKKEVESPTIYFKLFVDEVVAVSSYYGSYVERNPDHDAGIGQYVEEYGQSTSEANSNGSNKLENAKNTAEVSEADINRRKESAALNTSKETANSLLNFVPSLKEPLLSDYGTSTDNIRQKLKKISDEAMENAIAKTLEKGLARKLTPMEISRIKAKSTIAKSEDPLLPSATNNLSKVKQDQQEKVLKIQDIDLNFERTTTKLEYQPESELLGDSDNCPTN